MSLQALANYFQLRWHTVKDLEKKELKKKYSRIQTAHIKAVGIDEIHVGKGMRNSQYLTIIRDRNPARWSMSEKEKEFPPCPEH